jgi:hypothetical protein
MSHGGCKSEAQQIQTHPLRNEVNRIARLTAGAAPKRLAKLGSEQIIFMSGVHHVRAEWKQVQI